MYRKITQTAVMVEYTGEYTLNSTAAIATPQMATGGVRYFGETCRTHRDAGRPPSRANANAIRDAEVTVANPHRYCATTMPAKSPKASHCGSTSVSVKTNPAS